jgi:Icc-related predicted phosphoesterase
MKFAFGSDLHLEFGQLEDIKSDADILLLAGDICVADDVRNEKKHPGVTTAFSDRFDEFFEMCSAEYEHTYMIMGNHEYYHGVFQRAAEKIRAILPSNVTLLDDEYVDIDGTRLLGTTLWTDCNMGDWATEATLRQKMTDFRITKWKDTNSRGHERYRKMIPSDTSHMHYQSLQWLGKNMTDNCIVMSHHAPTWASIEAKYANNNLFNGGYASNLSEFILDHQPKLWIHGHMHDPVDYMVDQTRVVSNPRGYLDHEEQANYFKIQVVDV